MRTAILFPGQGAQRPDMARTVEQECPELLEALEASIGPEPFDRLAEGTSVVQPAVFCASLAGLRILKRAGVVADIVAGHSLGEFAALVAAEALAPLDGLALVVERARLTAEAAREQGDRGMLAILNGPPNIVRRIASETGLAVANDNAEWQMVLSGPAAGLERAAEKCAELGFRTVRLEVEGAFHNPAMTGAAEMLRKVLEATSFGTPTCPVYSGVSAEPYNDVRRQLAESLTETVRWREVLLALDERGVQRFVDTGPGRVMAGLVRSVLSGVDVLTTSHFVAAA